MNQSPTESGTRSEHTDGTLPSGQYWQGWPVQAPVGVVVLARVSNDHAAWLSVSPGGKGFPEPPAPMT